MFNFLSNFATRGNNKGLRTAQSGWFSMLISQVAFVNLKALF